MIASPHSASVANAASPRLQALHAAAQEAGLDFFAPPGQLNRSELDATLEQIHQRTETITPVLHAFLDRPQAFPRWGINE